MSYRDYLENRITAPGEIYPGNSLWLERGRRSGSSLKQINGEQVGSNQTGSLEAPRAGAGTLFPRIICVSAPGTLGMTADPSSLATPAADK